MRPRLGTVRIERPADDTPAPASRGRLRSMGLAPTAPKPGLIALAPTWDEFLGNQSSRFRKHLRQYARHAANDGWVCVDETRAAANAIEEANRLNDRWQNHRHSGAYHGHYKAAQRDQHVPATFGDELRVFALRRGTETASIFYGVRFRDRFYLIRQGNNPECLSLSPSTTLRALAIQRLVPEGIRWLDVVGGTEGVWRTEPPQRVLAVFHGSGWLAGVRRALARAVLANKRSPSVTFVRRCLNRVAPALAANAE
jgi:hypothetical protein